MKKIGLIAAASVLAAAGVAFGQGTVNLELTQPDSEGYNAGPVTWDGTGGSFSITLMVRAQIVGDAAASGLTTFDGSITGGGSGSFSAAALTGAEAFGLPHASFPGVSPGGEIGLVGSANGGYRSVLGNQLVDPANGFADGTGRWSFLPISTAPSGVAGAVGALDDVYKFTWTTSDNSARTVVLNVDAVGFGYQSSLGLVQGSDIDGGSFTINIIPAPGAMALMGLGGLVAIRRRR